MVVKTKPSVLKFNVTISSLEFKVYLDSLQFAFLIAYDKESKLLQWLQLPQDLADLAFSSMQILSVEQTPINLLTVPPDASIQESFHIPGIYTSPTFDLVQTNLI